MPVSPSAIDELDPLRIHEEAYMVTDQIRLEDTSLPVLDKECCAVCEHETARHDAVGRRYCAATQSHALRRNCICRLA
ncbi:RGCVC family protein [Jatrophihabitans cynanchi]|uniref:RGCVC family protein n=1 Tax=Jatrophihabitans cynanchi TaxID=2944128 RepID=UPI0038B39032